MFDTFLYIFFCFLSMSCASIILKSVTIEISSTQGDIKSCFKTSNIYIKYYISTTQKKHIMTPFADDIWIVTIFIIKVKNLNHRKPWKYI